MNTPAAPLSRHIRIVLIISIAATALYLSIVVIPSYVTGLYHYSAAEIHGSPRNGIQLDPALHVYRGGLGIIALFVWMFVPFAILPVVLLSVPVKWLTLTWRERRIWMVLTLTLFLIYWKTLDAAIALMDYLD